MIKNIATAILTTTALTSIIVQTSEAQAATVKYDFTIELFSGESFEGILSFDDSPLTGVGNETLLPLEDEGNVQVNLTIFGENITEVDDVDFEEGLFPTVNFSDGELVGLDLLASVDVGEPEFGGFLVRNEVFSFLTNEYFNQLGPGSFPTDNFEDIRGTVSYESTTTPEPTSTLSLITLGFIGAGFMFKTRLINPNKA